MVTSASKNGIGIHPEGALQNGGARSPGPYKDVPPDGGWGWMVLLGASITGVAVAVGNGLTMLIVPTIERYDASTAAVGLMPTIMLVFACFGGPFSAALCVKYSCRLVSLVGIALLFIACISCFFLDSLTALLLIYSSFAGAAMSMFISSAVLIVNGYFTTKRGRANGIFTAALGLGRIILAPLLFALIIEFGYLGTLLLMGGIALNGFVGSMLYEPVQRHMKRIQLDQELLDLSGNKNQIRNGSTTDPLEQKNLLTATDKNAPTINGDESKDKISNSDNNPFINSNTSNKNISPKMLRSNVEEASRESYLEVARRASLNSSASAIMTASLENVMLKRQTSVNSATIKEEAEEETETSKRGFLSVLNSCSEKLAVVKHPMFLIVGWSAPLAYLVSFSVYVYIPMLTKQNGLSTQETAMLQSTLAVTDVVSKLISSFFLDYFKRIQKYSFLVCMILATACNVAFLVCEDFWSFATVCLIFGYNSGTCLSLGLTLMAEYLGPKYFPLGFGVSQFLQGFVSLTCIPALGFANDATGDARAPFVILLALQASIVLACCMEPCAVRRIKRSRRLSWHQPICDM